MRASMSPNRARCVRFPLLRLFLANVVEHANHRDVRARASARNKMSVRQDRVDVVEQLLRENAGLRRRRDDPHDTRLPPEPS